MISTPIETRALATTEHWNRFLGDLRNFAAEPVPLETVGRLVRVAGLVLEATGIRLPVGSVCEVRMDGAPPVTIATGAVVSPRARSVRSTSPSGGVALAAGADTSARPRATQAFATRNFVIRSLCANLDQCVQVSATRP